MKISPPSQHPADDDLFLLVAGGCIYHLSISPVVNATPPPFLFSNRKFLVKMTYHERQLATRIENQEKTLKVISAGANLTKAARAVGINRRTIWEWSQTDSDFAIQLDLAWLTGRKQREYNAWLNHPFRGLRPPTGKGTRVRPQYSYR